MLPFSFIDTQKIAHVSRLELLSIYINKILLPVFQNLQCGVPSTAAVVSSLLNVREALEKRAESDNH